MSLTLIDETGACHPTLDLKQAPGNNPNLFINILFVSYILDYVFWPNQPLRISVRDFETEFIFHSHDHLDMVKRIKPQVRDEVTIHCQLK